MVIKHKYFAGALDGLELSEMFNDALWWMCEFESPVEKVVTNVNPMVLKAEGIFREALKKYDYLE